MVSLKRNYNETEDAYIFRVCDLKDSIGTWTDVQMILNSALGHEWTESAYRKKYQTWKKSPTGPDVLTKALVEQYQEVIEKARFEQEKAAKERYKLQAEKNELARWRREDARDELFEEQVIAAINSNLHTTPSPTPITVKRYERCGVLCFADMHFGADFKLFGLKDEILNEYSPEIFYERMNRLMGEVIEYINKEDLKYLKVFNLGDSLDGFIRHSQLWNLRYGVVDSAIILGDFMAKWLAELSNYAAIEYYSTNGNHGELRLLDGKKGQHLNENIEKVVNHIISLVNKNNDNFEVIENKSGLIYTDVVGFNVLGIHGEVKDMSEAIREFSETYRSPVDYLVAGHKHHNTYENCGVRKGCIGVGSIIGSDDYSISLRKTSDATASLITFEKEKGKINEHTFILN